MSTNNICFDWEIRKWFFDYALLARVLYDYDQYMSVTPNWSNNDHIQTTGWAVIFMLQILSSMGLLWSKVRRKPVSTFLTTFKNNYKTRSRVWGWGRKIRLKVFLLTTKHPILYWRKYEKGFQKILNTLRYDMFCFVWFDSLRPINNLSVKQGRFFLGWTSTKLG